MLGTPGSVPACQPAVKIDNTEQGRPSGLTEADVVFEEMPIEVGWTRLLAVYQSSDPETVGPVRSARSTDCPSWPSWAGRCSPGRGPTPPSPRPAVPRTSSTSAPARRPTPTGADDRRPVQPVRRTCPLARRRCRRRRRRDTAGADLPYPDGRRSPPGAEAADGFRTAPTDPGHRHRGPGTPAAKRGVRDQDGTAHLDESGEPVRAANVVVRFTPYGDSGVRDSTGALVPEASAVGEGDAWPLSGGGRNPAAAQAVRGCRHHLHRHGRPSPPRRPGPPGSRCCRPGAATWSGPRPPAG